METNIALLHFNEFIYLWPCSVFVAVVASLGAQHVLQGCRLSSRGPWTQQSGLQAPEHRLSSCSAHRLSCPKPCGIFQTRDRTHISCIGSRLLSTGPPGKPGSACLRAVWRASFFSFFCTGEFALSLVRCINNKKHPGPD